jgi:hypothetical protein
MTINQIFALGEKLFGDYEGWTVQQLALIADMCNEVIDAA